MLFEIKIFDHVKYKAVYLGGISLFLIFITMLSGR